MNVDLLLANLPAITGIFIGSIGVALILAYISGLKKQIILLTTELTKLRRELSATSSTAIGMGQRILRLEDALNNQAPEPEAEEPLENAFAISQATQMLAQGADANTVASICGISRSEAALMALMRQTTIEASPV